MHCVPSLPPGRLVAVPGAGLLRVPHVDPALLAEKAAAEADSSLARKSLAHIQTAGVSGVQKRGPLRGGGCQPQSRLGSWPQTHVTGTAARQAPQKIKTAMHLMPMSVQIQGSFEVLKGPPADTKASISAALCRQTKADGAAAIVIGSASRGGLKEALLGSIAANLAHNCDVPVVVVHKPRAEAVAGKLAGKGQEKPGDVTWLFRASTQEILGEVAAEQLDPAGEQVGGAVLGLRFDRVDSPSVMWVLPSRGHQQLWCR